MEPSHTQKRLTILGGQADATDADGRFLNRVALILPEFALMVVSPWGTHGMQLIIAEDYLSGLHTDKTTPELWNAITSGAVPLNLNDTTVFIRTDSEKIDLALAADELLQEIWPKSRIQFTGLHLAEVRNALHGRGETWRIAPVPVEAADFEHILSDCRVRVGTGLNYLYNRHTGSHILTVAEFLNIRPLLRDDIGEALSRLKEIAELHQLDNNQGYPELVFLTPTDTPLDLSLLQELIHLLSSRPFPAPSETIAYIREAEMLFDQFAARFAAQAGPSLTTDNPASSRWRAVAMRRLFNIDERTTEEWALGLGPEFFLNVRWLPGARLREDGPAFEPDAPPRVKSLIGYYHRARPEAISINVGRIITPLTERTSIGEEREVYIVSLGLPDGGKDIRLVRMSKWDVTHRLKKGMRLEQAIHETREYRDYIVDRLNAARSLEIPIPVFHEIDMEEPCGPTAIPVYYFEREYVPGMVTSRIPEIFYARQEFIVLLAGFLGKAAAISLALGRKNPKTFELYFDDGDELIQLNGEGLPERLMLIETTGSFADWAGPLEAMLPRCLERFSAHLEKARRMGVPEAKRAEAISAFGLGLAAEIRRMRNVLNKPDAAPDTLFMHRTNEPEGVRHRWEHILKRLRSADPDGLMSRVIEGVRAGELEMMKNE